MQQSPPGRPPFIRAYRPGDRDAVYEVCLRTAAAGGDATGLYRDPDLLGDNFAGPYLHLEPGLAFVLDDGGGRAVGYVLGTSDTPAFAEAFRRSWLPRVADRHPAPSGPPRGPDEEMAALLHRPERLVVPELRDHPAHLHIDLLPSHQRAGHGRALLLAFLGAARRAGADRVHLGMLTENTGARAFYDRLGFRVLDVPDPGLLTYLGRSTDPEG
ncbi:GNAT family N-acetyltransferase [Streptacidiphilus sp. ASG 303]|uniref:GNAT family N-acetyltransferase n=1 Tax=Streptacidiphilus sp. ASG 303 TaxID=2896847 RepID=UPI001E5048DF|nr:GNAT family N-acetyltransferase [Streptacidiphilus sp. ASG 303]MCD0481470.1 GNAT family N-acetyltransferase [Streptacidiphilus sp. ASG 303]